METTIVGLYNRFGVQGVYSPNNGESNAKESGNTEMETVFIQGLMSCESSMESKFWFSIIANQLG